MYLATCVIDEKARKIISNENIMWGKFCSIVPYHILSIKPVNSKFMLHLNLLLNDKLSVDYESTIMDLHYCTKPLDYNWEIDKKT